MSKSLWWRVLYTRCDSRWMELFESACRRVTIRANGGEVSVYFPHYEYGTQIIGVSFCVFYH